MGFARQNLNRIGAEDISQDKIKFMIVRLSKLTAG